MSRVIAQVIGIKGAPTSSDTTVYDPTCGSSSLLLKVADEATTDVTLYGQEKDATTAGLARMNIILHDNPTALIVQGNTLADPKFRDGELLNTFDFVVANPPFSDKRWSTGLEPENDPHERFTYYGTPPAKQGDYAYLLHIVRSLKSTGKGACILPHGVLFRGNAEADIRRNLVRKGFIKGIIGLPAKPLLRHRHPRLHRGGRQGERPQPQDWGVGGQRWRAPREDGLHVGLAASNAYQGLLERISQTFEQGRAQALSAVNRQLLETYWQVGRHIVEFEQGGRGAGGVRQGAAGHPIQRPETAPRQGLQPEQPRLHAPVLSGLPKRCDTV